MKEIIVIYGFGSFFLQSGRFNDIDILIVHQSVKYESCQFAIFCKQYILNHLTNVDITILSTHEEQRATFIIKSNACRLGIVKSDTKLIDLNGIISKVMDKLQPLNGLL